MDGLPISLAERILLTRRRLAEKQQVFGERFAVKPLTVNQWENGTMPNPDHLAKLKQLFKDILGDEEDTPVESVTYQLLLPFDEPVKLDFRMSPHSTDKVNLTVQVKRKAS
jgi:transcriptional regulator with XRE-family HTH domain